MSAAEEARRVFHCVRVIHLCLARNEIYYAGSSPVRGRGGVPGIASPGRVPAAPVPVARPRGFRSRRLGASPRRPVRAGAPPPARRTTLSPAPVEPSRRVRRHRRLVKTGTHPRSGCGSARRERRRRRVCTRGARGRTRGRGETPGGQGDVLRGRVVRVVVEEGRGVVERRVGRVEGSREDGEGGRVEEVGRGGTGDEMRHVRRDVRVRAARGGTTQGVGRAVVVLRRGGRLPVLPARTAGMVQRLGVGFHEGAYVRARTGSAYPVRRGEWDWRRRGERCDGQR